MCHLEFYGMLMVSWENASLVLKDERYLSTNRFDSVEKDELRYRKGG